MSDPDPQPPRDVGPRGEPTGASSSPPWMAMVGGCLGGVGVVLAGVFLIGLVLLGLVAYTCSSH